MLFPARCSCRKKPDPCSALAMRRGPKSVSRPRRRTGRKAEARHGTPLNTPVPVPADPTNPVPSWRSLPNFGQPNGQSRLIAARMPSPEGIFWTNDHRNGRIRPGLDLAPVRLSSIFLSVWKTAAEGEMATKRQHVVPRDGKWAVRRSGSDKATRLFDTQRQAIAQGREIARKQGTELYIHGRDGRIRERDSYGRDPYPPKG